MYETIDNFDVLYPILFAESVKSAIKNPSDAVAQYDTLRGEKTAAELLHSLVGFTYDGKRGKRGGFYNLIDAVAFNASALLNQAMRPSKKLVPITNAVFCVLVKSGDMSATQNGLVTFKSGSNLAKLVGEDNGRFTLYEMMTTLVWRAYRLAK